MKTIAQKLLLFVSGVVVGVAGITFWEIFGKPVLPYDGYDAFEDETESQNVTNDKEVTIDEIKEWVDSWTAFENSLGKTQPIKVR